MHLFSRIVFSLMVLCAASGPAAAAALVTIVDGEASLIEGTRALLAVEGQKVADETLVRTGTRTTLLRLEWPDGSAADFGPDTQAMLNPSGFGQRAGRPPTLYLLRGFVKLSSLGGSPAAGLLTPRIDVQAFTGTLVVAVLGDETWAFAESGAVSVLERELKPASTVALKSGQVYVRDGAGKGQMAPRPTPAQMQRVPRGFRDSLPLRTAALKDKAAAGKPSAPPPYAELREWLVAELPLRKSFTKRFAERAKESTFRAGLVEDLKKHPEWEPLLFPERFLKPASAPR